MAKKNDKPKSKPQAIPNPIPKRDETDYTEIIGAHGEELKRQGKLLNWTYGFMVAILIVCLIAFITFMIDAWRFHAESYVEFTKTLEQVNFKLQTPAPTSPLSP